VRKTFVVEYVYPFDSALVKSENTKGGSITVLLTPFLTTFNYPVLKIKTKIVSCHTADSKPVKQEVNSTVILPPLVFTVLLFSNEALWPVPWTNYS